MDKLTRQIELDTRAADDKARTVPAVVSTSTPVKRGDWSEILLHTKAAIDLSRAPLPLLNRKIARIGDLPDFKPGSRTALSDFSDLEVVYENGEYKYASFSDLKETLTLSTYGKLFSISRQALVNDDLNAFTGVPRGMASTAARVIDDLVIAVLTTNAALN